MAVMDLLALAPRRPGERRVGVTPGSVKSLVTAGHSVTVEAGSGLGSGHDDDAYRSAGAVVGTRGWADLLLTVEPPTVDDLSSSGAVLGFLEPLDDLGHIQALAATGSTLYAFELVPRTTRAQMVDALSSQATIAGYQAMLEAAAACNRIFPMLTTAAGTLRPAAVLVLGAGVAGLGAIATARRLGAVVSAFDVRSAAAEQVESLGARFVTLDIEAQDESEAGGYAAELATDAEARLLKGLFDHVAGSDVVVTTAAIPGRPAPRLVTSEMVEAMRPGSVIVDASAATGGNCELTRPGEAVVHNGVTISGPLDLASRSAHHASQLLARNTASFVGLVTGENASIVAAPDDDVALGSTVARQGAIVHPEVLASIERAR